MIIDTHSHCYWNGLESRIPEIINSMKDKNVSIAIQIGCNIETSLQAIKLSISNKNIFYASVGFHPCDAKDINSWREYFSDDLEKYNNFDNFLLFLHDQNSDFWDNILGNIKELKNLKKLIDDYSDYVVAVGECGLDFHYLDGVDNNQPFDKNNLTQIAIKQIENQKFFWLAQLKISQKYGLPLIIHTRDAGEDTISFIKKFGVKKAIIHCFSENWDFANQLCDFSDNIIFGFGGALTYKKNIEIQKTAQNLPIEKIVLETDSPFLSPVPMRGKTNEPSNVYYVFDFLCTLRSENKNFIEEQLYKNSHKFFNFNKK